MKKYIHFFKIAILDSLEYKFDFFMNSFKYSLMVLLMSIVWLAVEAESPAQTFSRTQTIQYFIFATLLYSFSNFHTWHIEDDIRTGSLSKFLVKPLSTTKYYLSLYSAQLLLDFVLKILVFVIFILLSAIPVSVSFLNMLLFFIYLPIIFLFSFAFLGSISLLSFWVTEAYAIRWAATILVRFLSGILVPVLFFPESIQKLLYLSPFPYLAYAPIQLLSNSLSLTKAWEGLLTLCVWTVVTWGIYLLLFRRGIAKYEGVGI